jgi:hypothetical protein
MLFILCAMMLCAVGAFAQTESEGTLVVEKCWDYPTGEAVIVSVSADAENVFVGFGNGSVKALGLQDGRDRWSADLGGKISSNLVVLADRVLVMTSPVEADGTGGESSTLRALSKETGLTLFSAKVAASEKNYLLTSGDSIVAVGSNGPVTGLTLDGKPRWNFSLSGGVAAEPIVSANGITIPLLDKSMQQIGFVNGETTAKNIGGSVPNAIAADAGGRLFIGDDRGRIYSTNAASGGVNWTFKTGGRVEHLVSGDDRIYAASVDNFVYSISKEKGSVVWKKRLTARSEGRPLLWEKMLIVSSFGESSAAVLDIKDGKTLKTIDFGTGNVKIASTVLGTDGSIILPLQRGISVVRFGGCTK